MAVLVVKTPDAQTRVLRLGDQAVLVGRTDACDVSISGDDKVSGKHLRIAPLPSGGWVARDLGSTWGTRKGKRRILRARLEYGDVLVLGQTRVAFLERAPTPVSGATADQPLVSGTLELRPAGGTPTSPIVAPAAPGPVTAPPAPPSEPGPQSPETRPVDARSMGRAVALLVIGLLTVVGVELGFRSASRGASARSTETEDLQVVLRAVDDAEEFQDELSYYLTEYPDSPHREKLEALATALLAVEEERSEVVGLLNGLTQEAGGRPESEVRGRLLELVRTYENDTGLFGSISPRARMRLKELDDQHDRREAEALATAITSAEGLLAEGNAAAALRLLGAYRFAWPSISSDARSKLREVEDRAIAKAKAIEHRALEASQGATQTESRRVLGRAWRHLAGTPQAQSLSDALRFTGRPGIRPGAGRTAQPAPGATPPPEEPDLGDELLAKAAEAEQFAAERRWAEAREALGQLAGQAKPGLLRDEWTSRAREMELVLVLVEALASASSKERPPRPKLSFGRVKVVGADAESVTFEMEGENRRLAWSAVPSEDLVLLLEPRKPTADQRLGLAVLAASTSRREEVVRLLVPLFEEGEALDETNRFAARHLFGRSVPPAGGYRVHKGEILEPEAYERRLREERIAALRAEAVAVVEKIAKEPIFKKLAKLRAMRGELDTRRSYALLAIFNVKHYPYPADKSSQQYQAVQKEVDRRVAAVREIWDDPYKVKIQRTGSLEKSLDAWDQVLTQLRDMGQEVADLEEKIAPYASYVTGEPITIREYFRNGSERELLKYNTWVRMGYNPKQIGEARGPERQQTQITNAYRWMMGFKADVVPGPAPYGAIDKDTALKVLDEGRVTGLTPLMAVRIDDRLVRAARGHSLDMQARGFFGHHAPANEATGEKRTSPFDRMKAAGYRGAGASENIAGASSAQVAHDRWCKSSGHHRNILSPWTDQGVGQAGHLWTQNYGTGGGGPPVIEDPDEDREDERAGDNAGLGAQGDR